jgi:hypothetical protein
MSKLVTVSLSLPILLIHSYLTHSFTNVLTFTALVPCELFITDVTQKHILTAEFAEVLRREPLSQYLFTTLRISAINFLCVLCGYFFWVTSVT